MTRSLLFQPGATHSRLPPCSSGCDRVEVPVTLRKNGRLYRFVLRDKIVVDDVFLTLVKAAAFALAQGEPYAAATPGRNVRDFLIKLDVVI